VTQGPGSLLGYLARRLDSLPPGAILGDSGQQPAAAADWLAQARAAATAIAPPVIASDIATVAVVSAGGGPAPARPIDAVTRALALSGAGWDCAIVSPARLDALRDLAEAEACALVPAAGEMAGHADWAIAPAEPPPPADAPPGGRLMFLTTGTTGRPRLVPFRQEQVVFLTRVLSSTLGYRPGDRVFSAIPVSFDYGFYQVLLALASGASLRCGTGLVLIRGVQDEIARYQPSVLPVTPAHARRLADCIARSGQVFPCVRLVTSTGAPLLERDQDRLAAVFPAAEILPMYGMTECKRISVLPPGMHARRPGSVGLALPGTSVRIAGQDGTELPDGVPGEAVVTGPHVAAGYWHRPGGDSEPGDTLMRRAGGWALHTGDILRKDADGYLYYLGRQTRDLVKARDERVSLLAVEAAAAAHPAVGEALATAPCDAGGTVTAIVLRVTAAPAPGPPAPGQPDPARLRAWLRRRIPAAALALLRVEVIAGELPMNENGKIEAGPPACPARPGQL
jgi:acyl-CoA synthetase (AMP-forming)/AMP-acid ligase II